MSEINCNACEELKSTSPNLVQNGITDTECASLAADTGLNPKLSPKHKDAEDLHDMNDCLVGIPVNDLDDYGVCGWQDFMSRYIPNLYTTFKGIICAVGGIWTYIHNLLTRVSSLETRMTNVEERVSALETWKGTIDTWKTTISNTVSGHTTTINNHTTTINNHTNAINNINRTIQEIIDAMGGDSDSVTVVRKYSYTVPVGKFISTWQADCTTEGGASDRVTAWFSGSSELSECFISIPVTEMEEVVGVWAQPYVVAKGNPFDARGKDFMQTVAVQTWSRSGNNIIVNFDAYELAPHRTETVNGGPYPLTIDFLVVGTKTINTLS